MKPSKSSRSLMIGLAIGILLSAGTNAFAEATTYRNGGLKNETIVTLEVKGRTATGTFVTYEYGDEIPPATPFTGKVIRNPRANAAFSSKSPSRLRRPTAHRLMRSRFFGISRP